jgi:hypothetical protein
VRALEEPAGARHVGVNLPEQERRAAVADELDGLLGGGEPRLIAALKDVYEREPDVALGEPAPVARPPVVVERALGVVARDGILVDAAVDARERGVDGAALRVRPLLGRVAQRRVEDGDGLRVVARVVVGEAEVRAEVYVGLGAQAAARLGRLVDGDGGERIGEAPLQFRFSPGYKNKRGVQAG